VADVIGAGCQPGETVRLTFLRGGRQRQVAVVLGQWPAPTEV